MKLILKDGQAIMSGYVVRDVELRMMKDGKLPMIRFDICTGRDDTGENSFDGVVAWRELAKEFAGLRKFDRVLVTGKMSSRQYKDKEFIDCVADFITLYTYPYADPLVVEQPKHESELRAKTPMQAKLEETDEPLPF